MSSDKTKEFRFFSEQLKKLIGERKVTQGVVAAAAKTTPPTLRGWLAGKSAPDIYHLLLLAEYFGLATVDEMIRPIREDKKCRVIPRNTLVKASQQARTTADSLEALLSGPTKTKPKRPKP